MGLFNQNENQEVQPVAQRQKLEGRYASSRHNILLVLAFTAINVILLLANSNTYFLFSAYIPYAIVDLGMFLCGKYPAEIYGDLSQYEFLGTGVLAVFVAVAAVICVLYLLCWLFSKKKRVAWMIIALVMFVLDTALMLLAGISADNIIDVVFHGWVILSLSMGVAARFKLKKLPEE
jgi:hypothetical protein